MKKLLIAIALCLLSGCVSTRVGALYQLGQARAGPPRNIWVTIDGTGNSQISRTNAARLYELVDGQNGKHADRVLATYYAEGVGSTKGDIAGLAAGTGMSRDIREAYEFLTRTYRPGDRIFLSGFSRGAYAVRALGGLIALAGIPDMSALPARERGIVIARLFAAYKTRPHPDENLNQLNGRRVLAMTSILDHPGVVRQEDPARTRIAAMAIWDTVEALGWPDRTDDPTENLTQYFISNCNIDNVFHALALDDDRSYSFTPIFANTPMMRRGCPEAPRTRVEEVWFAGAHADVGGSYAPGDQIDGFLPGVSLNWMLDRLQPFGLFDPGATVFEDPEGPIHDARAYTVVYKGLSRHFRYPLRYHLTAHVPGHPKVHVTAFDRLSRAFSLDAAWPQQCPRAADTVKPVLMCGKDLGLYGFVPSLAEAGCLTKSAAGYELVPGQTCVTVVCDQQHRASRFCGTAFAPEWADAEETPPVRLWH